MEDMDAGIQNKKDMGMPTVISTFAGCGGSSLGYKWAGFRELLAIDWDDNSKITFETNFDDVSFWKRDITGVSAKEILDFCKIRKGDLDLLDSSPPCQGFFTAGKRKVTDKRNDLFKHLISLIEEIRPKVFVMENVAGMSMGKMKGRFKEIMRSLKKTGYATKCKMLNSANYGVPQIRRRLFFIGVRPDLGMQPVFPMPESKTITVGEALRNVPEDEKICLKGDNRLYLTLTKPGEKGNKYHPRGNLFNSVRLSFLHPANTIIKTVGMIHPKEDRWLTIAELKRLSTFPDSFKFVGSFDQKWARIGNAVMPKQMEAIARTIKEKILMSPNVTK